MKVVLSAFVTLLMARGVEAFVTPSALRTSCPTPMRSKKQPDYEILWAEPLESSPQHDSPSLSHKMATPVAVSVGSWLASAQVSMAAGPDWGIFEGRTLSLLHPLMMGGLLAFSISTALLGFQWRRQRTLGDEISALKKSLPKIEENAEATPPSPIEKQIQELQDERKELANAGPRDKHFAQGALLAFLGIAFAIEGPLNTYARAGKLFPGPHLYVGAALVVVWALAVATVPSMQKGNDAARTLHIGANLAGLGLFGWQVVSGVPILFKVIEFTKWP